MLAERGGLHATGLLAGRSSVTTCFLSPQQALIKLDFNKCTFQLSEGGTGTCRGLEIHVARTRGIKMLPIAVGHHSCSSAI